MNEEEELQLPAAGLIGLVLLVLVGLGWLNSPRDLNGRPLLLLPDVKAVEDYRQSAEGWVAELRQVDGEIAGVLANDSRDLFARSRQAQGTIEHSVRLAQNIDRTSAPSPLVGLHGDLAQTSLLYLDAARLALQWLGVPTEEHRLLVEQKLSEARRARERVEGSLWLEKR